MKKVILVIFTLALATSASHSQRWKLQRYRIEVGVGASNYFGDIGGAATQNNWFGVKDLEIKHSQPVYYLGFMYKLYEKWDMKLNFNYGYITGNDLGSLNELRGLNFKSTIFESSVQVNYIFFRQGQNYSSRGIFNRRGMLNNYSKFNAYAFASLGVGVYTPSYIQPENIIESRESRYQKQEFNMSSKFSLVAPFGVGVFYILNKNLEFGLEIGPRLTLTDYIDGFSSYWSNAYDVYYLTLFTVKYRVQTNRAGYPVFNIFNKRY